MLPSPGQRVSNSLGLLHHCAGLSPAYCAQSLFGRVWQGFKRLVLGLQRPPGLVLPWLYSLVAAGVGMSQHPHISGQACWARNQRIPN
jgi:hypothetical protein